MGKVCISGTSSGLGRYLLENVEDAFPCPRGEVPEASIFVHAAFDKDFSNYARAIKNNVNWAIKIADRAYEKVVFISTIDILRQPQSSYAITKLLIEDLFSQTCKHSLSLRCSAMLGDYMRDNHFTEIIKGGVTTLSRDSMMNYILHKDIAKFIKECVVDGDAPGILNFVSSENVLLDDLAKQDVRFGDYKYDSGKLDNRKLLNLFPEFDKTSLQVVQEFTGELK